MIDEITYKDWKAKLNKITQEQWENLKNQRRTTNSSFREIIWTNGKNYKRDQTQDGFGIQATESGKHEEIPYKRKFNHESTGRFALRKTPVSYWARDFIIACIETTDKFRDDDNLTQSKIDQWLYGKDDPDPKLYGYPIGAKILKHAVILDMSNKESAFYKLLESHQIISDKNTFYDTVIKSRNKSTYPITWAISEISHEKGFDGVYYSSARAPNDVNYNEDCLIVFKESLIEVWPKLDGD